MKHCYFGISAHVTAAHGDGFGQVISAFPTEHFGDVRVFRSGDDDLSDVLTAVFAPVPHKEWMRSVIGVAAAVHLNVSRI